MVEGKLSPDQPTARWTAPQLTRDRFEMASTELEVVEEMFVQVARGSTSDEGSLTLTGVSPSTLYFSDRPTRVVGHMTTGQFSDRDRRRR